MENYRGFEDLLGQELTNKEAKNRIVELLLQAYADEWIAGYYYMLTAELLQGPLSEVLGEEFRREASEEITVHARRIAERLQELGAEPPRDFREIWNLSGCKYPQLPTDPYDVDGFIIAAVRAEMCAIEAYKKLYMVSRDADPVTEELVEDLLRDEVAHKTKMLNLLSAEGVQRLKKSLEEE
ncbi:MAG: ferritin [Desulfurococcales archaeon]|nr:ferritin [Desulfurococcales archaeon]